MNSSINRCYLTWKMKITKTLTFHLVVGARAVCCLYRETEAGFSVNSNAHHFLSTYRIVIIWEGNSSDCWKWINYRLLASCPDCNVAHNVSPFSTFLIFFSLYSGRAHSFHSHSFRSLEFGNGDNQKRFPFSLLSVAAHSDFICRLRLSL